MRTPCEVIVKHVLPAFRAIIAKRLIEDYGFSQEGAAKALGTSQASISYYLNSKRGVGLINRLKKIDLVNEVASDMAEDASTSSLTPFEAMLAFCGLCISLRTGKIACTLHSDSVELPIDCQVCSEYVSEGALREIIGEYLRK
ncbi:MAG: transcriptional regulator [Candidatus Geothermarchaeales archaeon]